jgi:hypothetical protein
MTQKGVLAPVRMRRADAEIVVKVLDACVKGAPLDGTQYELLPSFHERLARAVSRTTSSDSLTLWELEIRLAQTASTYLLAFSHPDAPGPHLTNTAMDAVFDVAIDLLSAVPSGRGRKPLSHEDVAARLRAAKRFGDQTDERWRRRLQRRAKDASRLTAEWEAAARAPLDPLTIALLRPRDPDVLLMVTPADT